VSAPTVLSAGIVVADIFVPPLERLPEQGELLATGDFLVQSGGCAANTAVSLERLGVRAAVCGCVGADPFGQLVRQELEAGGIDASGLRAVPGWGTSKTVIIPVVGEDRRFIHTFGANAQMTANDIPTASLERSAALYVGGYLLLPSLLQVELVERLRLARHHGTRVVLDVAVPSGRPDLSLDSVRALLPLVDYFVPNDDEALALTGEPEPHRQAQALLDCGAGVVAIKMGERGAYVRTREIALEVPAPAVDVVEPSGAGDAFAAGLLVGILEDWDLSRTIRFASVVGGSACTALGCTAGVFTREEAERFLAAHPLPARPSIPV
jgi:sugar/nucleoside kinase (ribokinase family)